MTRLDTPDAFASAGAQRPGPLITLLSRGQYPVDRTGLQLGAYDSLKAAPPVLWTRAISTAISTCARPSDQRG